MLNHQNVDNAMNAYLNYSQLVWILHSSTVRVGTIITDQMPQTVCHYNNTIAGQNEGMFASIQNSNLTHGD